MSKLDNLLVALSDDSPWSMKAAEVLSIPNSEIRDLLLEYVRRIERAQWFGVPIAPTAGRDLVLCVRAKFGTILYLPGVYSKEHGWAMLYHGDLIAVDSKGGWAVKMWRYLPEYPEEGQ